MKNHVTLTRFSRKATVLVSALAVVGLAATALPAQAADPGVTDSEIVLGMQLPQTGLASPGYNKVDDAMRAYFDYVNSKGGVYGRSIKLEARDDAYSAGKTISTASSLITDSKVFAMVGSVGTQTHSAVIKDLNRRGIPDLFVNSGNSGFYTDPKKYPTTFAGLGTYVIEAKILGKYIKETFPDKKVGILYQTDDFGKNALAGFTSAGLIFEPRKTAATFIAGTHGSLGLASQIKQLNDNGVQIAIIAAVASATAVAISTAKTAGYNPDKWVVISVGADATTFQTILAGKKVPLALSASWLTGVISASHAPAPGDAADEYVKAFKQINADFNKGSDKTWDNNVLQGMNIAYQTVAALQGVGKDLTRKALINWMETKGSTLTSAAFAPVGFSKTSHEAYTGFWIGAYDASTVLQPVGASRVVYTTDSAKGLVTVSTFKRPA
ncbi:MAG: ABC transporter substrate-binding protein, partial [Actinobacteria bacterium]|nr:ABC transporter substrate-binding protein [Actinomycetota bacterium]